LKYGIESRTQSWKKSQYLPLKSMLPFVEFAFAAYFSYFLFFAICKQQWLSVPFLMLFTGGFGYVALCSIAQWFPQLRNPWRTDGTRLPL
ncbi:MAG: glycosyl transferase family 2, partial [Verrucomicrobiota bacterium]